MADHPFDRLVSALEAKGCAPKVTGNEKLRARCPAHADRRPSLSATRMPGRVLVHCFSGCRYEDVLSRLNLTKRDLFLESKFGGPRVQRARLVATYQYFDDGGCLVAEKIRFEPKEFAWRSPDPVRPGRIASGLHGRRPGLYKGECLTDGESVFLVEGEKAVDRLRAEGQVAVCSPYGASAWKPQHTMALRRHNLALIVILPDGDKAGRKHAQVAAKALFEYDQDTYPEGTTPAVKIVTLTGLAAGGDIVDWLDAGNTTEQLWKLVGSTPLWTPRLASEIRRDRKREQGRIRAARFRARRREQRKSPGNRSAASDAADADRDPALTSLPDRPGARCGDPTTARQLGAGST